MRVALVFITLCLASCALRSEGPRQFPYFQPKDAASAQGKHAGCAVVKAWNRRATRGGTAFSVSLASAEPNGCRVRVVEARFLLGGRSYLGKSVPGDVVELRPDSEVFLLARFWFDNLAHWNRDERNAQLSLDLEVGGARQVALFDLVNDYPEDESE